MATKFHQGLYTVNNPYKYMGDVTKVRFMSSWEYECHKYFDNNDNVIKWSSEGIAIPYFNPVKKRMARYFPDYYVEYINPQNEVVREIVEVKPLAQTKAPRKNRKHALYEQTQFAVNMAKFAAATQFCKERNLAFRIVTEKSIFS